MKRLQDWIDLFLKHKNRAVYLDIETTHFDGDVATVALYRCSEFGEQQRCLVRDKDLNLTTLCAELDETELLVTFNGLRFDIPRINTEWPGAISKDLRVLDLYQFACELGVGTKLKILERTFGIQRSGHERPTRSTHEMWDEYKNEGNLNALEHLMAYNLADARNLLQLAETLVKWASWRIYGEYQLILEALGDPASNPDIKSNSTSHVLRAIEESICIQRKKET